LIEAKNVLLMILLFLFTCTFSKVFSQSVRANPTRPSASDNAFLTEYSYAELEFGLLAQTDSWTLPALLKFSPSRVFELGFSMTGLLNHYSAPEAKTEFGDAGVQLKVQFYKKENLAVSAVGRIEFPANKGIRNTMYLTPTIITEFVQLDATVGGIFQSSADSFIYAFCFSHDLNEKLNCFFEVYGESAKYYESITLDFGLSYSLSPDFIIDSAYGIGLNSYSPSWQIQVGFTKTLMKVF